MANPLLWYSTLLVLSTIILLYNLIKFLWKNVNGFKTYMFIWAGQFASMLTSYAVQFAIVIWLSLEYKSAEVLAFAGIATMLPQALIG